MHSKCLIQGSMDSIFIKGFEKQQKFQPGVSYQRKLKEHNVYCNKLNGD